MRANVWGGLYFLQECERTVVFIATVYVSIETAFYEKPNYIYVQSIVRPNRLLVLL